MSEEDENKFQTTVNCCYFQAPLVIVRVRDHDHFNGKYRGAAHSKRNLNAKKPKYVPLCFFNGLNLLIIYSLTNCLNTT